MVRIAFAFFLVGVSLLSRATFGIRSHASGSKETIRLQTSRSKATEMFTESSQAIDKGANAAYWLRHGFRALFDEKKKLIDDTLAENAGDAIPYSSLRNTGPREPEATIGFNRINASLPLENATDGLRFRSGGDHTLVLASQGTQTSVAYSPSLNSIDMSTKNNDDSTLTAKPKSATYSARLEESEADELVTRHRSRRVVKSERAKTKWDGEVIEIDFSIFDREETSMMERLDFFKRHAMGRSVSPRGRKNILGLVAKISPLLSTSKRAPIAYDVDDELYDRGVKMVLAPGYTFKVEVSPSDSTSSREAVLIFEQPGRTNTVKVNAVPANDTVKTTLEEKAPKGFLEGAGFVIHELEISDDASTNTRLSTALSDISVRPAPPKPLASKHGQSQ